MKPLRLLSLSRLLVLAGVFLSLAGCGGGSGEVKVGMTADPLTISDAPSTSTTQPVTTTNTSAQLEVTVSRVDVHVAADGEKGSAEDSQSAASGSTGPHSGWTTVMSDPIRLNLYDLTATEKLLGDASVPAGRVTQIRLVLANDITLVSGSTSTPVTCPSCTETGLKIVTEGSVQLAAGETLHVTLDFDSAHSLTVDSTGYRLDPVIRIARTTHE